MRSSVKDEHLSGAERIVHNSTDQLIQELLNQAISSHKMPDTIIISFESIDPASVRLITPLEIKTMNPSSPEEAEEAAAGILMGSGISRGVVKCAFDLLSRGPAPGCRNMRGAVIMAAESGERLEPDLSRGIRVSRVDYTGNERQSLAERLKDKGIFHRRVMDALAIASKVADRPETMAELCWSDDPDYTTGYVASKKAGYVRITNLKKQGSLMGGRVFFVNCNKLDIDSYIYYLEKQPVLVTTG